MKPKHIYGAEIRYADDGTGMLVIYRDQKIASQVPIEVAIRADELLAALRDANEDLCLCTLLGTEHDQ